MRDAEIDARRQQERARPVRVRIVWDAGMSSPVARGLGQAERDWFRSLAGPNRGAWKVRDVTNSAREGFVLDGPAQHQIAVHKTEDAIIVLLGQAPRMADKTEWGPKPAAPARPDMPIGVRIVCDAEVSSPVPKVLGQAERDWFGSLAGRGPLGPRMARDVQYVDFTLSAEDGFVVDSPALPRIAVSKIEDAVNVLLVSARPDPDPDPFSPVEEFVPYHKPVFRPMG